MGILKGEKAAYYKIKLISIQTIQFHIKFRENLTYLNVVFSCEIIEKLNLTLLNFLWVFKG